ncbi:hypothetical protein HOLleu_06999 [Holothuria leucospilota]|uniref:Uncharacterized protein n=1 Tax=Holothuria leucospilota TaxID=206669 RepID=A0A9Q1CM81_HOLLE|nr:hypothetical protein HOLleu_06999 [Holothuria leucospilota]
MYGNLTDSLIRDRTVCGIPDNGLGERLLREDDFMLPEAVKVPFCRPTQSRAKDLGYTWEDKAFIEPFDEVLWKEIQEAGTFFFVNYLAQELQNTIYKAMKSASSHFSITFNHLCTKSVTIPFLVFTL